MLECQRSLNRRLRVLNRSGSSHLAHNKVEGGPWGKKQPVSGHEADNKVVVEV